VYKAQDIRLNRLVALKFLPPELSRDPEAKERLIHEARASSSLQHPNICVVYDIDETDDGQMFISMECLEGQTLETTISGGQLTLDRTLEIATQAAEGLARAHEAGIVHGDLKPANIIITREGMAKLLDFGLARGGNHTLRTGSGTIMGTAAYMSPEQVRGARADQRSDVWSLGVILYEMVTGRRPFAGEYEEAVLYGVVNEQHRPPSSLRPDLTAGVQWIIDRCLEKDPGARFADAGAFLDELRRITSGPAQPPQAVSHSIAVLPFADLSPGKDNRYFSDGLTEEIIAKLSRIRKLRLVSRTSALYHDRAEKSMREIAAELGVRYLLEGSVRKHGSYLRITTHLIDADQDAYLWAETYDGSMDDVFEIQESVASRIVKALRVRVSPDEKRGMKRRSTQNTEAFQLYLKGRFFWNKRSREGLETAIGYFEKAIEQDPHYALAWAGIADSCIFRGQYVGGSPEGSYARAWDAVHKALEYDDRLAEAHASLGILTMLNIKEWGKAGEEFRKAVQLDPNYPTAHHWYGEWLSLQGRFGEALLEISRAATLDPLSPAIIKDRGMLLYYARDFDGAIESANKALELDRHFSGAHRLLSIAYLAKGQFAEAIAENRLWGELAGVKSEAAIALALCHACAGRREESLRLVGEIPADDLEWGNLCRAVALVYAALGEDDLVFAWLEKAYEKNADALGTLRVDHKLDRVRADPRFSDLLRRVGLAR
jgi:serine/threonine-protein kinase